MSFMIQYIIKSHLFNILLPLKCIVLPKEVFVFKLIFGNKTFVNILCRVVNLQSVDD